MLLSSHRGGGTFKEISISENCAEHHVTNTMERNAFTLAEVLITLGIIGIVAALTMPTLITNIKNKGYVEKLKKSYSLISQVTSLVSEELGIEPAFWVFSLYYDGDDNDTLNRNIIDAYKKHFKVVGDYTDTYLDYMISHSDISYRYLNGETNANAFYTGAGLFHVAYVIEVADGSTIGFVFSNNKRGGVLWTLIEKNINLAFIVDVNGTAKPNQIGRDIFWFVLNKNGQILPYGANDTSDCTTAGKGYSCAAKIINEGQMNY